MAFDFENFLQGGIGGAAQGGSVGGIPGAVGGGLLGGLTAGFFGGKNKPNTSSLNDIISQTMNQINDFSNKLDAARGNVLASYQNLSSAAMKNYLSNYQAALGGRGIGAGGGAFATGAGQEAVKLQDKYNTLNADMLSRNAEIVGNLQSQLLMPSLNVGIYGVNQGWEQQQKISSGLGNAAQTAAPYLGNFLRNSFNSLTSPSAVSGGTSNFGQPNIPTWQNMGPTSTNRQLPWLQP